jgi:hypothetical protein
MVGDDYHDELVAGRFLCGSYDLFDEFEAHTRIPQMTHSVVPFSPMRSQWWLCSVSMGAPNGIPRPASTGPGEVLGESCSRLSVSILV